MLLKKFVKAAAIVGMAAVAFSANAFTEGTDYQVLEKPVPNAQGTLIKVFSYACPFCYKYDKSVTKKVVKAVPELKFTPIHLRTKGDYGLAGSYLLATMIVKDQANGTDLMDDNSYFKRAKMALYHAYHDKRERWTDGGEAAFIKTGLDGVGMSVAEYDKEKANPAVQKLVDSWEVAYDIAKIQGVPAFVVDGKYLILTKSIRSVQGMIDLVKELHAKSK